MNLKLVVATIAQLLLADAGNASNTSDYTTYNLDRCENHDLPPSEWNPHHQWSRICKGYKGAAQYQIQWEAEEGNSYIAFGPNNYRICWGPVTFGRGTDPLPKVEWRLRNGRPIASIQRWQYDGKTFYRTPIKSWLVVTKLDKTTSCSMAYIEAGYPSANAKARAVADDLADDFACAKDSAKVFALPDTDLTNLPYLLCRPLE